MRYLYADGWKLSLKTETELSATDTKFQFAVGKSVAVNTAFSFSSSGTDYVYINCPGVGYLGAGRGFS